MISSALVSIASIYSNSVNGQRCGQTQYFAMTTPLFFQNDIPVYEFVISKGGIAYLSKLIKFFFNILYTA